MTQQHLITPPPELVEDWIELAKPLPQRPPNPDELATLAARWGADQELEACLQWFSAFYRIETWMQKDLEKFRAARRPEPLSLNEQPTDKQLQEVFLEGYYACKDRQGPNAQAAGLRAVLKRWGNESIN